MQAHPARALFIGRFQPFHRGHEKILAHLLKRYTHVTIAIGSAQEKRTRDNPFSASERREIVGKVARAHVGWTKKMSFAYLKDDKSNKRWTQTVGSRFPDSSFAITSANPLVRRLLGEAGYTIDPSPLFRRAEWMGKRIREKMRSGRDAYSDIPLALMGWMKEKGEKIIRICE